MAKEFDERLSHHGPNSTLWRNEIHQGKHRKQKPNQENENALDADVRSSEARQTLIKN